MTHMGERHVNEPQQQRQARQRHAHAAGKGQREATEQPDLQRRKLAEISRHPLDKAGLQRRHPDEADRLQQPGDAVGGQQCGGYRSDKEGEPPADNGQAGRFVSPLPKRFGGGEARQGQPEHEAAMEIGPHHHHRQNGPWRGTLVVPRAQEGAAPGDQKRQRQDMRAGEQMRQQQRRPGQRRDQRRQRVEAAQQEPGQQADRRREPRRGQDDDPAPAGIAVRGRVRHFAEPLARHPMHAGEGVRERVGCRQRPLGEHPAAGGDVQIGVGIVQQRRRRAERPQQGGDADDPRPRRQQMAPCGHRVQRNAGRHGEDDYALPSTR